MKYLKLIALLLIAFVAFPQLSQAQDDSELYEKKGFSWHKVITGGNIGLSFGNVTVAEVSPLLGYRLTPRFTVGAGYTYQYYKDNRANNQFSSNNYGPRVFTRFNVLDNLYAHAEFERLTYSIKLPGDPDKIKNTLNRLPLGAGYRQRLAGRTSLNVEALYDVLYDPDTSPYATPFIFRGGIVLGL